MSDKNNTNPNNNVLTYSGLNYFWERKVKPNIEKAIQSINKCGKKSGSIVSFKDRIGGFNLNRVVAHLEPIQNLNGKSSPYPAGGGPNEYDGNYTLLSHFYLDASTHVARYSVNLGSDRSILLPCESNKTYFVRSGMQGTVRLGTFTSSTITDGATPTVFATATTTTGKTELTIKTGANDTHMFIQLFIDADVTNYGATLAKALDGFYYGSENICPIFGHTEVQTTATGKNLLNMLDVLPKGYYVDDTFETSILSPRPEVHLFNTPQTVTISVQDSQFSGTNSRIAFFDVDSRLITNFLFTGGAQTLVVQNVSSIRFDYGSGGSSPFLKLVKPQIELGSTATLYTPHSGSTTLTELGINQWDEEWEVGGISSSNGQNVEQSTTIRCVNYIPITGSGSYYLNFSNSTAYIFWYDADKNYIGNSGTYLNSRVWKFANDVCYVRFQMNSSYGVLYNNNISINFPCYITDYYPHTDVPICYGGTLDVTNGKLTCTMGYVDLGSLTWTVRASNTNSFWTPLTNMKPQTAQGQLFNGVCGCYKIISYSSYDQRLATGLCAYVGSSGATIAVYDTAYTDAAAFKTAMAGQQLVYELATPIIYQLEPQYIQSVLGQNNVFTDSGEVSVWYVSSI